MALLKSRSALAVTIAISLAVAYWTDVYADEMVLIYFTSSFDDRVNYTASSAHRIVNEPTFSVNNRTVFYIHGHGQNFHKNTSKTVILSHLQRRDSNVIAVDWSSIAADFYIVSVVKLIKVGRDLGKAIVRMIDAGLKETLTHIVGHSLGAQVGGYAGREAKKVNHTLQRISGLDPAGPLYYFIPLFEHLSDKDAMFVDIIHTDRGYYGGGYSTGTVDFWPNQGRRLQPGCNKTYLIPLVGDDLCSHQRSCYLWAESVTNITAFPATNCHVKKERRFAYMGYGATSKGNYYLKTGQSSPYSLGIQGIKNCR